MDAGPASPTPSGLRKPVQPSREQQCSRPVIAGTGERNWSKALQQTVTVTATSVEDPRVGVSGGSLAVAGAMRLADGYRAGCVWRDVAASWRM